MLQPAQEIPLAFSTSCFSLELRFPEMILQSSLTRRERPSTCYPALKDRAKLKLPPRGSNNFPLLWRSIHLHTLARRCDRHANFFKPLISFCCCSICACCSLIALSMVHMIGSLF